MRVRHVHAPRWALTTQLTYRCHLDQLLLAIADLFRLRAGIPSRTPERPLHVIGDGRQLTPRDHSTKNFTLPLVSMRWATSSGIPNYDLNLRGVRSPIDVR